MKITCSMCTTKGMIPHGSHCKQFKSFLIVNTKTGKKIFENQCQTSGLPGMMFEQCERAIGMLTAGMSERDVAWHFQHHESTISQLLNRFSKLGTCRPTQTRQTM